MLSPGTELLSGLILNVYTIIEGLKTTGVGSIINPLEEGHSKIEKLTALSNLIIISEEIY